EELPSGKLAGTATGAPAATRPSLVTERPGQRQREDRAQPTLLDTSIAAARPQRRLRLIIGGLAAAVLLCTFVLLTRGGRSKAADPAVAVIGQPAAPPVGSPVPTPATSTPPTTVPLGAGRVFELKPGEGLLDVWSPPAGSPQIPARIPAGDPAIQLSTDGNEGLQHVRLRLPAVAGRTGVVVVINSGVPAGRTLLMTVRNGGAARGLRPIKLADDAWQRIVIDCGEAGGDEVVVSCNGAQPLAVARAIAWSGAPPESAMTAFVPGTLQPLGPIGTAREQFRTALGNVVVANQIFPDPQRVRIAVSNLHLAVNKDALLTLTRSIATAWGADPTTTATEATLLPYASAAMLQGVAESAVRAKAQVLVIVLGSEEVPKVLPLGFQVACRLLSDGGVLPVLLVAPAGWQEPLRSKWVERLDVLQARVPQMPVIDLMEVPIGLARQDLPTDLHNSDVHAKVAAGMAAGIGELRARIAWLAASGGLRTK
ncbi:MAG: hypothetical protein H0X38_01600, partial [Planctomycetes bacterium]|nr:hypothetical protein [Planctomycetota bacterium]